jgi:hypothetical protein
MDRLVKEATEIQLHDTLMTEAVSKTLDHNSILTQLIA